MTTNLNTNQMEYSKDRKVRIPAQSKSRNPHVKELYDGNFKPKRESPKNNYQRKEKHRQYFDENDDEES